MARYAFYRREDHPPVVMATCLSKAVNSKEDAVKEKHVRSAIIGTYQIKGGTTFWECALRLGLKENPITCWKFCHVLHKVLREGHDQVLRDSQRFKGMLQEHGKFWGHLKTTGYGELVKIYCTLLVVKLGFHMRNNRIPGNLEIEEEKLFQSAGEGEDALFQLSIEMLDYLDAILDLQAEIFKTMDSLKCNSMTNAGQCRLKPLIPCIQDSILLYDYVTKILFRLHETLSPDLLNGHRDRFRKVFFLLKEFFKKTMNLQYFKNLIDIQDLPKNPPNFLNQHELSNYQPSRLTVFQSERDMTDAHSDTTSEADNLVAIEDTNGSNSPDPGVMQLLLEKDRRVKELENEVERLIIDSKRFKSSIRTQFQQLQFEIEELKGELNEKSKLLADRNTKLKEADQHVCQIPEEFLKKLEKAEANAKSLEEKFVKMKELYNNLREEHIQLLRKSAVVEKELSDFKKSSTRDADLAQQLEDLQRKTEELESNYASEMQTKSDERILLEEQLRNLQSELEILEKSKVEIEDEFLQTKSVHAEEETKFQDSVSALESSLHDMRREKEEVESTLKSRIENKEKEYQELHTTLNDLKFKHEEFKREKAEQEQELNRILESKSTNIEQFEVLKIDLEKSNLELKHEKEELSERLTALTRTKSEESEKFKAELIELNSQVQNVQTAKEALAKELKETSESKAKELTDFHAVKIAMEDVNSRLSKELEEHKAKLLETSGELEATSSTNRNYLSQITKLNEQIKELERETEVQKIADTNLHLDFLIGTFVKVIKSELEELDSPRLTGDFGLLDYYALRCDEIPKSLQRLQQATKQGFNTQLLLRQIIFEVPAFGQEVEFLIVYGGPLSRTCKDIQQGDDLLAEVRRFGSSTLELLQIMKQRGTLDSGFADVMSKWQALQQKLKRLGSSLSPEQDAAEVLDKELHAMEQAIEEAARRMEEILRTSRASDTGIKLEVNEKLIDSCSSLMNAIKVLVQKSKGLQIEIVSQGKGTSSAKEFYKRNHRWTDGLISAAKAVGIGAKLLLESADKAVGGKGGGFEYLIASSQEIAASTIQLVVASQVRADRSSKNLALVKQASTGVKTATAHVVATAKDCSQLIEESDIDVGKVTPHNAKRLELEEQAEVLRLESQLEKSRRRLAALRQHHYHNEDD